MGTTDGNGDTEARTCSKAGMGTEMGTKVGKSDWRDTAGDEGIRHPSTVSGHAAIGHCQGGNHG